MEFSFDLVYPICLNRYTVSDFLDMLKNHVASDNCSVLAFFALHYWSSYRTYLQTMFPRRIPTQLVEVRWIWIWTSESFRVDP